MPAFNGPTLEDKIALVAGASAGIGRAAALLFARAGAKLVVGARRRKKLDELVAEIAAAGGTAVALAGDVTDESYDAALVETAVTRFGGLDVAFNNVGSLGPILPTHEMQPADWRRTIETNLTSAFLSAKHQVPAMLTRGGGSLIFTSSFVGHTVGFPGLAAYAASKAGLIGLAQTLAVEYGAQGLRANALLPGGTETEMYHQMCDTQEARDFIAGLYPLRRVATPQEIAQAALYLASDVSSFTTGSAFLADGGVSVNRT